MPRPQVLVRLLSDSTLGYCVSPRAVSRNTPLCKQVARTGQLTSLRATPYAVVPDKGNKSE